MSLVSCLSDYAGVCACCYEMPGLRGTSWMGRAIWQSYGPGDEGELTSLGYTLSIRYTV